MTATSHDMTAPRPEGTSGVYAVYGDADPSAVTLAQLREAGATLKLVPPTVLAELETATAVLRRRAVETVAQAGGGGRFLGAVCYDDWWNTAVAALNPGWPLESARRLVIDKARLYSQLRRHGVPIADFRLGTLSRELLVDAVATLGPRPVLKPNCGDGSRGVYRYRDTVSPDDNLDYYRQLLALGHIDSRTPIIAAQYLGGPAALEISVDVVACGGRAVMTTVHEKATATAVHPFVDHVMISPPSNPDITAALPGLPAVVAGTIAAVGIEHATLHIELRLHQTRWHVLDVGVRPGAGLIAHSAAARTGVDPRVVHLAANLGHPVSETALTAAAGVHPATCIACCYVAHAQRPRVRLGRLAELATTLRGDPAVIGWHINVAEVDDEVYVSDAGLSVGVGAACPEAALDRLRALIEPYAFTTSSTTGVVVAQ
jgi:hypothetical protein